MAVLPAGLTIDDPCPHEARVARSNIIAAEEDIGMDILLEYSFGQTRFHE